MGRALEAFATRIGVSLGHATVRELMQQLFGGRRRLARGSVEEPIELHVEHDPEAAPAPTTPSAVPPSVHDLPTRPIPVEIEAEATVPAPMMIEPEACVEPTRVPPPLDIRFHRRVHTTEKVAAVPRVARSSDRRWMVFAIAMLIVAVLAMLLALTT